MGGIKGAIKMENSLFCSHLQVKFDLLYRSNLFGGGNDVQKNAQATVGRAKGGDRDLLFLTRIFAAWWDLLSSSLLIHLSVSVFVKCMIVPEHISVTGESVKTSEFDGQNVAGRERLMQLMNVPDRIVLTGGNNYEGFEAEPLELMKDHATQKREESIQDLPSVITLEHKPYLDRGEPNDEAVKSENSIAIEENPLQELKPSEADLYGLLKAANCVKFCDRLTIDEKREDRRASIR
ncbi:unnamed protein product [Angiostrongylus costaricensis]|uniref:Mitochondrial fission factor n=1 Tax=Angiostrongylus costaricensis TaxID=334426 RepID=A0A158PK40_ANGCS|nr:unnamed protein product [Angiostrongylus costaricensis]